MSTLERAIEIAAKAHAGQKDKSGSPYILHPIRVMLKQTNDKSRIAAVLHDVVEDTGWTIEQLRKERFPEGIVEAVSALTKKDDEPYLDFVARAKNNPIAAPVKKADLEDNLDLTRISAPRQKDFERMEKYRSALRLFDD